MHRKTRAMVSVGRLLGSSLLVLAGALLLRFIASASTLERTTEDNVERIVWSFDRNATCDFYELRKKITEQVVSRTLDWFEILWIRLEELPPIFASIFWFACMCAIAYVAFFRIRWITTCV